MDGFIATSRYYADFMAGYLGIPRERIHVVYPGLNLAGHGGAAAARAPARRSPSATSPASAPRRACTSWSRRSRSAASRRRDLRLPAARLRLAGREQPRLLRRASATAARRGPGRPISSTSSRPITPARCASCKSIDVLSVPTVYREPKGLYVLEALANGVPVVQPRHGSFPELIEATGGGLLVNPDDPADLARGLEELARNTALRHELASKGQAVVRERFTADVMARATMDVYHKATPSRSEPAALQSPCVMPLQFSSRAQASPRSKRLSRHAPLTPRVRFVAARIVAAPIVHADLRQGRVAIAAREGRPLALRTPRRAAATLTS